MITKLLIGKNVFIKRFAILFVLVEGIALLLLGLSTQYTVGFNASDSLDGRVYLVYKNEMPIVDDIVAFRPPENPYYHTVFLKIVKGVEGDSISWAGREFYVNNIPMGIAKKRTLKGDPLAQSQGGVIGENEMFVWTPHVDSFDSRYEWIGLIDQKRIIGKAVKLL